MNDHEALRRLIALYAQLLDDRRWADLAGLFTEDGTLPWAGRTLRGREEIAAGLPQTQPDTPGRIKHFTFPPVLDVSPSVGAGVAEARGWTDVIVSLVNPGEPAEMSYVGRYHDRFRRAGGKWRYVSHVTVATGDPVPEGESPPPAI